MAADRNKRFIYPALVLILLVLSAYYFFYQGEGKGKTQDQDNEIINTLTVTDCIGRQVEVPEKVERVGCLYAFSGHVAVMLGQGPKIVAVPDGLKRDVLLNEICPSIAGTLVPVLQGSINIEELVKARPDLVFVQASTARSPGETEKLNKFHIPYLVVDFNSIAEQQYAIAMIGRALGVSDKAEQYNQFYQESIERVEEVTDRIPKDERIKVYHSVNEATRTDTRNSLAADWMEKAGVINVSADQELRLLEGKNFASLEQILLWDPEVILANEDGVPGYILTNSQWSSLSAVKNKEVYQMPIGISRWGHPGGLETPLAIMWTAKLLYPDYFKQLDIKSISHDFYKKFFNYTVTDEMLERIMTGEGMRGKKSGQ